MLPCNAGPLHNNTMHSISGLRRCISNENKAESHGRVEHSFGGYLCTYSKVAMASLGAERGMWT